MANEFKIKNGLIVSGSTEIEQNLTVYGTLTAQIHITGTTGYNTFSGSISSSIGSLSSSIASTDYTQNVRLDNLESQSGSIRTDFNSFTTSYTTVSSSLDSRLDSLETESGSIRSDFNGFTSSYTTVSSSLDSRLDVLEAYSGSQQVPTASYSLRTTRTDVYCKNMSGAQINKGTVVRITGAVGDNPLIGVASLLTEGQSANTLGIAAENIPNDSFGLVITEGVLLGVNTSGMTAGQLIFLGANGTFTTSYPVAPNHGVRLGEVLRDQQNQGSIYVRVDNGSELGEAHDVYDTTTNSSYGDLLVKSGSVWVNSRKLNGNYEVTGSLTITQNLNVLGSSSLVYVTSSQLAVSSSTISVNVFEPAERFGGLKVYDSGSSNATASLLWDSLNNHWIYQNASGSNYSGGMLLSGPRNSGSLGDESGLTSGKIAKSIGGDHLDNSIMTETGTTITVSGNLVANSITGAFDFFGLVNRPTLVSGSSQIDVMSTTNIARIATTGSNIFVGTQTISGSILPSVDNTYDLGSPTHQFRDLYLSSASLYIDGTKVIGSTAQELQITTDTGQSFKILESGSDTITLQSADGNITLASSGGGDVIMDPTTGIIALKGTTTLYSGNKIVSSDGNSIQFGNGIAITGSIISTVTPLVSGSSQISFGGLSNVPSGIVSGSSQVLSGTGIWSGSAQLPSGVVSGSVQVDVMSTTNIARLATTGSNTFTGAQTINASNVGRINLGLTTGSTKTAGAIIAQTSPSYSATGKLGFSVTTWGVNTDYDLTEVMAIDVRTADTKGATVWMNKFGGGRFGLGTENPASIFHISGSTNDIGVRMTNSTSARTFMSYVDTNGNYIIQDITADSNRLTISTGGTATFASTITSNGGSIQTYNQTSGYGVGFYFPGSTTPSIFADNVLRIYQRVEVWGGNGGYYLDVRNSAGDQKIKFDGNGNNSFLASGNFNIGYAGDQGAKLYVQANQASYAAYFEQTGGATSSYGGVRITTNSTGVYSLRIDNAGTEIFSVKGSGVAYAQNALGVGYSDPQYTLQVNGSIGLRANSQNIKAITGTGWGYSVSSYKVVMLGDTANNVTVSIGYDPSGNSNSAFTGDGREILFRNGASFVTPNAANTSFNLNTLVMKDGKVAVGTADPTGKLHVYSTSASDTYLETGTSGTSGKLIFKTSDNSDLNKYIAQESYYMMFSGNANEGFKWRDSNSNILMSLFGSNNAYGSRLGIGTQTPAHSLDVNGNIRINQSVAYLYFTATTTNRYLAYNGADTYWRADGVHYFEKTSGYKGYWDASSNLTVNGTITESSAIRYKENIKSLENSLDKIIKLKGVSYNKIETGIKEIGFIAEEVNETLPELVLKNGEGEIESVAYGRVSVIIVEAIKELKKEIEELKAKL